jgi:hypothetical protein
MPGDVDAFARRIHAGLKRLATFQHDDGFFSIWCGGKLGADITARVAHRLLGFRKLDFSLAEEMLDQAAAALKKQSHRDNSLLALGPDFREEGGVRSVEDAAALYFYGQNGERDEALAYLRRTAVREDGTARWPAKRAWGGALEVTADAARVLLHAGDRLFLPAFRYVTGHLVDGRLYSTADTRALVELLASLRFRDTDSALIDDQEVPLNQVSIGKSVTALTDNLIVRVDEAREINYLELVDNFRFDVDLSRKRLRLGERVVIRVTPREESIAPLVRLYLPGCLAWVKGGANAQTAHLPVEAEFLEVEAVAVRPGRGQLRVAVHDMYDADKVGVAPGVEVRVGD